MPADQDLQCRIHRLQGIDHFLGVHQAVCVRRADHDESRLNRPDAFQQIFPRGVAADEHGAITGQIEEVGAHAGTDFVVFLGGRNDDHGPLVLANALFRQFAKQIGVTAFQDRPDDRASDVFFPDRQMTFLFTEGHLVQSRRQDFRIEPDKVHFTPVERVQREFDAQWLILLL